MPSLSTLRNVAKKWASAEGRMTRIKEKTEEAMGQGLQLAEVGGTAFAFGYANQRYGNEKGEIPIVAGVAADLGAAVAFHGLAFAGAGGKYKEHMHNMGDGALAAYLYRLGAEMGHNAKLKAPAKHQQTRGVFPQAQQAPAWAPYQGVHASR